MAVPKRKKSKAKIRSRKASHKTKPVAVGVCPQCGAARRPHRACPGCGYYRERQVISVEAE
ncbi:MAG: 50S ribosomal protein L32 [Lentisphaerae bacterium]|nr:50S ribosomal protein L32 [Lentisphaerota bacterium]